MHARVAFELDGLEAEVVAAALAIYASHLRRGVGGGMRDPEMHCGIGFREPPVESAPHRERRLACEHWALRHDVAQRLSDELFQRAAI